MIASITSEKDHEVLGLFPLPIYKSYLPNNLSNIIKWLDNQELENLTQFSINSDIVGERSKNTYILNEPECKDIVDYILSKSKYFGKNFLHLDIKEYNLSQSWISIKKHSQSHVPHTHGNSIISGVFYYGPIEKNTPGIGFRQPLSSPQTYTLDPGWVDGYNPLNNEIILEATPGIMYLFPSYLPHFVPPNNSKIDRKSLAFNIISKDILGSKKNLTELKLL